MIKRGQKAKRAQGQRGETRRRSRAGGRGGFAGGDERGEGAGGVEAGREEVLEEGKRKRKRKSFFSPPERDRRIVSVLLRFGIRIFRPGSSPSNCLSHPELPGARARRRLQRRQELVRGRVGKQAGELEARADGRNVFGFLHVGRLLRLRKRAPAPPLLGRGCSSLGGRGRRCATRQVDGLADALHWEVERRRRKKGEGEREEREREKKNELLSSTDEEK